jgi:hypothetical protein
MAKRRIRYFHPLASELIREYFTLKDRSNYLILMLGILIRLLPVDNIYFTRVLKEICLKARSVTIAVKWRVLSVVVHHIMIYTTIHHINGRRVFEQVRKRRSKFRLLLKYMAEEYKFKLRWCFEEVGLRNLLKRET